MKWYAISGSWRTTSPEVQRDAQTAVADILHKGDGIVTGGALGVDYVATAEALRRDPTAERIKIILPTSLAIYASHYRNRALEGVITTIQAEKLIQQLTEVRDTRKQSLIEMSHVALNEVSYYDRNTRVLAEADELVAFQVNGSMGVQDTIDKASNLGMAITLKHYTITV